MAKKIRKDTSIRQRVRLARKRRIRKKIVRQKGKIARLVVYRSNRFLYAQIVDDLQGRTLMQANTREEAFKHLSSKKGVPAAKELGKLIGEKAMANKIERLLFDRNGYSYHGRMQAVAEGVREVGLRV